MSASAQIINMPASVMEELHCSLCKGYLSCAPIQVLPDGSSICGRCSADHEGPAHRELALEAVLRRASFPCQFQHRGCETQLPFDSTKDHETNCVHRPLPCPSLPPEGCEWTGTAPEVYSHCFLQHPQLVTELAEFHLQTTANKEEVLLVVSEDTALILDVSYDSSVRELDYSVFYLSLNIKDAPFKLTLVNQLDPDCTVTLKAGICLPYNRIPGANTSTTLCLNDVLPAINNPDRISVTLDLTVTKHEDHRVPESKSHESETPKIDSARAELIELSDFHLPRWEGHKFLPSVELRQRRSARRRINLRTCRIKYCGERYYRQEEVLRHLYRHGFQYISDKMNYKVPFSAEDEQRAVFSLKFNGVIYIEHEACEYRGSCRKVILNPLPTSHSNQVTAVLEIRHPRYSYKSAAITIDPFNSAPRHYFLPFCVKQDDHFTVTLTVF